MAHQIFGENENIFGYQDLKINIFYSAGPLDIFYDVKYGKRVEDLKGQGILKAGKIVITSSLSCIIYLTPIHFFVDDVHTAITEIFPEGCYYTNLEEFLSVAEKKSQSFEPIGEKIRDYSVGDRQFEFYLCDKNTPNFIKFHSRLETFIYWYIDAASKIEHDNSWRFFLM